MDNNSYKPVYSFGDLRQFGIANLTGEACAYSMRQLCDVNEDGKELLEAYFGVQLQLADNYNSSVNGKPSIGSLMLNSFSSQDIAQFAFFRAGALAVVVTNDREMHGVFDEERLKAYEEYIEKYPKTTSLRRNFSLNSAAPRVGDRMVHAATGRVQ
jgi:hypothetical protein